MSGAVDVFRSRSLNVACLFCGAPIGERCRTENGTPTAVFPHAVRDRIAAGEGLWVYPRASGPACHCGELPRFYGNRHVSRVIQPHKPGCRIAKSPASAE